MNFTLKIWRQPGKDAPGALKTYTAADVSPDMSILEMLDMVNQKLAGAGEDVIAFDSDCREGICGSCGLFINGRAHGPSKSIATCELRMRHFEDGATITIEPWRAKSFPVIKDLVVDRTSFDRIIQAGGFVSVNTGGVPDANAIPVPKTVAEEAMDAAACIGCGACVAACKNASAMLFVAAKVSQLALLPQGHAERRERVLNMVAKMDEEGFGGCSNTYACEAECPKNVSVLNIARMNREYLKARV